MVMADQMAYPDRRETMGGRFDTSMSAGDAAGDAAQTGSPIPRDSNAKSVSTKKKERDRVRVSRACDRCKG
jgi:hypothetical protein